MTEMMEEVFQQPAALAGLRKYYASPGAIPARRLRQLVKRWPPLVVFTGMGSSLFAAYPAQAYLSARGIRAFVCGTADVVIYHPRILGAATILIMKQYCGYPDDSKDQQVAAAAARER